MTIKSPHQNNTIDQHNKNTATSGANTASSKAQGNAEKQPNLHQKPASGE